MNIDVCKKNYKGNFLSVQYLRLFSPGSVFDGFVTLVRVKILFHVLDRCVTENYSFSFSCVRTNTMLTSPSGKLIFYLDKY